MRKLFKFLLYLILIIIAFSALIYFASGPIVKKIVGEQLEKERIAGIYKLKIKNAYFDIFQMGITITGVELIPDSSAEIKKLYRFQKHLAHIHIKRLTFSDIDIMKFIQDDSLIINKIKIINPTINLYKNPNYTAAIKKAKGTTGESELKNIDLEHILVKGIVFNYFIDEDRKADLTVGKANLELIEPSIDLSQLDKPLQAIKIDDMVFEMQNINYQDFKGLYSIISEKLTYQFATHSVVLENISVKPKHSKKVFANKHPFQSDRMDATVAKITIKGLDFQKLINHQIVSINNVDIDKLILEVYRDKNHPFNFKKYPKLPQQALRAAKQKFEIAQINIKHSSVVYLEKAKDASKTGKVELKSIQGNISSLGNTAFYRKNKKLKVHLQSLIYGKGKLNVDMNFPLNSSTFYFSGQLGKTPMNVFNAMTIPNAGTKVKNGVIEKMNFKVTANNNTAHGNMNLYYDDLEISILKKQKKSGQIKSAKIKNLLVNNLMPQSNPNKRGKFYEATIELERNKNKSVFNYLWESILSGIKDTMLKKHKKKRR